jgi:hypothetical protein
MKRMVLGFVLALAALVLVTSSPLAAAPVPSAADQAFIASLAAPAPASAAERPIEKSADLCFAAVDCGDGTSVSCSSSASGSSCSSIDRDCPTRGSVTCDGVKKKCPACSCEELLQACAVQCGRCPITSFQCNPYRCTCLICPN